MYLVFIALLIIDKGLDIDIEAFIFVSVLALPINYAFVHHFKIIITDDNLRGYDFWGKYHSVEWNSILNVKPIQVAWLKYVRIENSISKRPLWIPLFLNDMSSFNKEAIKRLDEGNPFRVFLETQVNQCHKNA